MSSVRKKDQAEHRFTVLDKVLDMYSHTITVISNDKIFDRTYSSMISRIEEEARTIYHYVRSANEDYDNRKQDEALMRIKLQEQAIELCKWLKTDVRLAKNVFHLRAKKVAYWTKLINESMAAINGWHIGEKRNYRETYGL